MPQFFETRWWQVEVEKRDQEIGPFDRNTAKVTKAFAAIPGGPFRFKWQETNKNIDVLLM